MLEVFGVDAECEQLYSQLLALGQAPIEKLAEGECLIQAEKHLSAMQDVGLVVHDVSGRWQVVPLPDALRALRSRQTAELDTLISSATATQNRLLALSDGSASGLRSLFGRPEVQATMNSICRESRSEICGFDKPPYVTSRPPTTEWLESNSAEYQALMRGVSVRSIYHPGFDENRLAEMAIFHEQGEKARTGDVPMKLVVVDGSVALMPAPASYAPDQETRATLVHNPTLVEALQSLFEAIWYRSLPIDTTTEGVHGEPRRDILVSLLMSGTTDVAIANQLGVTERSVRRWISGLMEELDVQTRLQLGAALARTESLRADSRRLSSE